MSEPTPFASLGPLLLARKGAATPALRHSAQDNEFGADDGADAVFEDVEARRAPPAVKRQQAELVSRIADSNQRAANQQHVRHLHNNGQNNVQANVQANSRRAAFTLRLDDERHLKLKLASTLKGASAQHLVTRALDQYLAEMPEVESLAAQIKRDAGKA